MKNPVRNSSRPGDVVTDLRTVTCCTARVCLLLNQNKKFPGRDTDSEVPTAAIVNLLLALVSQSLDPESDISRSGEEKSAAMVFEEETNALLAVKRASVWEVPSRLDATQKRPASISRLISAMLAR